MKRFEAAKGHGIDGDCIQRSLHGGSVAWTLAQPGDPTRCVPISRRVSLFALSWAAMVALVPFRADARESTGPVDRFFVVIEADATVSAEMRNLLRTTWQNSQEPDGGEFLTQALAVMSPRFRQLLDAYDAEKHVQVIDLASQLRSDSNPFVAIHAAVLEAKSLVALERIVEAGERIESLTTPEGAQKLQEYTYYGSEVAFLRGFCLVSDLQYADGLEALSDFLEAYPEASPRLKIAAEQMLLELAAREPGQIGEVVDLMDNSRSRLHQGDSGTIVQGRQQRIVDLLDKLIKEAEDQEKNCKKCSKCNGKGCQGGCKPSSGSQGQNTPKSPMQESRLPGGGATEMELREARRANPADSWGALPPAQRERILQALRESFPSRYRQLVEQYYEELAKKP